AHPMRQAYFGQTVSVSGNRLAVGAGTEGAAYLFQWDGATWNEALRIAPSDGQPFQNFGGDALVLDERRLIVGVPYDGHRTPWQYGAAYDYEILCPGDVNGDWFVNLADLSALLSNFGLRSGARRNQGDLDGDGDVDLSDLTELLATFGTTCQ